MSQAVGMSRPASSTTGAERPGSETRRKLARLRSGLLEFEQRLSNFVVEDEAQLRSLDGLDGAGPAKARSAS